jgi:hypothetical protein
VDSLVHASLPSPGHFDRIEVNADDPNPGEAARNAAHHRSVPAAEIEAQSRNAPQPSHDVEEMADLDRPPVSYGRLLGRAAQQLAQQIFVSHRRSAALA